MSAQARLRETVFPKRPGRPQQQRKERGNPRKVLSVRVDGELRKWIEEAEDAGMTATSVVVKALYIARDASEALGAEWWEVERRAGVEGTTPGEVLGKLTRAQLEAEKKRK